MGFLRCLALWIVAVVAVGVSSGCAHTVLIESTPGDAVISVDGKVLGDAPQRIERTVFIGDQMRVTATKDGYEPTTISVQASEWYPYPLFLAVVPLLGVPLSLPALVIPFAGPFIAIGIAVVWAVVTSPALLSIGLTRKYPDTVPITLKRKLDPALPYLLPEIFGVPEDITPNPLPDVGTVDDRERRPPPNMPAPATPSPPPPPQADGNANPIP